LKDQVKKEEYGQGCGSEQSSSKRIEKVDDLILVCINEFTALAMNKLGLDPRSKERKRPDLEEARLAIDSVAALFNLLGLRLPAKEKTEIENALAGLRMLFVEVSQEKEQQ
jgi:hypothetical protein